MDLSPHPHHRTHLVVTVLATAVLLTVAFHLLAADRMMGIGFALFALLLLVGMHAVAGVAEGQGNRWAYLFLIPTACAIAAEALSASAAVRLLGLPIAFGGAAFFAYWSTAPRVPLAEVRSFWPKALAIDTLWPFDRLPAVVGGISAGDRGPRILLGVVLAVPFLLVFGALFVSADPLFGKAFGDVLGMRKLPEYALKAFRDLIVLLYFLAAGWTMATRRTERRGPATHARATAHDRVAIATFLGLVNALFAAFVAFQFAYFFGGASVVRDTGISYAEYARNGFFQLLWAAGLVALIVAAVYRATDMRQWGTKELSLLLVAQTGVVLASAARRLLLYVDVYGLTVSRWWAAAAIGLIGATLLAVLMAALARRGYDWAAKVIPLGATIALAALLLVNVEGIVARYDADRFLSGKTTRLDVSYLWELHADAVPALVDLTLASWPTENADGWDAVVMGRTTHDYLLAEMRDNWRYGHVRSGDDWRGMALADYRAAAALARLK